MKTCEKLRQLKESNHLSDKQIYTAINMDYRTFSSKIRGIHKFKPHEKRALEKFFGVKEGYLDDDALPVTITTFSKTDLMNIVISNYHSMADMLSKYTSMAERIANLEALLRQLTRKKQTGGRA
jgi:hypothetical protein